MRSLALLLALAVPAGGATEEPVLWAGHEVVVGEMRLPLLGKVQTRSSSLLLARVEREAEGYRIVQEACHVDMAPVMGGQARIDPAAVRKLPPVTIVLRPEDGAFVAPPWRSGWGESDFDGDGKPGVTIHVDAPLCGGALHVSSDNRSTGRARFAGDVLRGEIKVRTKQRVLGTEGACLSVFSGDTAEELSGTFAYRPVPAGSTCASLLAEGWPVAAREP